MDKELIKKLKEEYPNNIIEIEMIIHGLDTIGDVQIHELIAEKLETVQQYVNKLYTVKPSDVLIEVQVLINQYRNQYDVTDPREIINYDNGKGFVQ